MKDRILRSLLLAFIAISFFAVSTQADLYPYRASIDLSGIVGSDSAYFAYPGLGNYAGNAHPNIRILFADSTTTHFLIVRADSDIMTLEDLEGKKVFMGATGSNYINILKTVLEEAGINVEQAVGGWTDGADMMKDRQIDAFMKGSSPQQLDAVIADINAFAPIRVLDMGNNLSPEAPYLTIDEIDTSVIPGLQDQGKVKVLSGLALQMVEADFPEDLAYEMIKAYHENWDEIKQFHGGFDMEPIQPLLNRSYIAPFHTALVKYMKELGVTVPDNAIPPEYKD